MINVVPAAPAQRETALMILLSRSPAGERAEKAAEILDSAQSGSIGLEHLLLAEQQGRAIGAGLMMLQPDRTGFVWPPVATEDAGSQGITDAILREVNRRLDAERAWMGQCLVEPQARSDREALARNEFVHLTDLQFLVRPFETPLPEPPATRFETVAYDPATNRQRFADVLKKTYENSLDCPELNGTRNADEALTGHQGTGVFDPSRWQIYRVDGNDVGLSLLSAHPDQDAWELVYMGTVPEARGRNVGRIMLADGLRMAQAAGATSMFLAVDFRNIYALNVYRSAGFLDAAIRSVYVRLGRP